MSEEIQSDEFRGLWLNAVDRMDQRATAANVANEARLYKLFREACKREYPDGDCSHPECPNNIIEESA